MKKVLVVIFGLMSLGIHAQQRIGGYSQEKSANWVMTRYVGDPLAVREYKFNNGLTLITSNQSSTKRVYTMVAVRTGSKNDPKTNTGLAHYLEHMLFKGTDKYGTLNWEKEKPLLAQIDALYEKYNVTTDPVQRKLIYRAIDSVSGLAAKWAIANEYDKMCGALGAEGTNAFTSNDMTVYVNDIPNNKIPAWLALESERFRNPILRLFHTELEAVYEEKNIGMDREDDKVWETLYGELFKKHNYGLQTTIGTVEHLKNPSLVAIREYYNKYYVANNMAIIMSGDFNPDSVAADVWKQFSKMRTGDVPSYVYEWEDLRNVERTFDVSGPKAEYVTIGYRIPGAGTKEARIANMISMLLSNSTAGLLDLDLVQKQMVMGASAGIDQMNDYGVFVLMGNPQEGQTLDSVKNLLLMEMEKIRKGDFDENLLKAIVLNADIDRLKSFKNNDDRTRFLMQAFINGMDYRDAFNELWDMSQMTKENIVDMANEYLNADRVVIYKRKGELSKGNKIEKPQISPVELNRDKRSAFVDNWLKIPAKEVSPTIIDLNKEIQKIVVANGTTEVRYVKNSSNRLFRVAYRYDKGTWANPDLTILSNYMEYAGGAGMSAGDISMKMYKMGCSYRVVTSSLYTDVVIEGPEESYDAATSLVSSIWGNVELNEGILKQLIGDMIKAREDAKSDPAIIRRMLAQYAIYGAKNPMTNVRSTSYLKAMKVARIKELINELKKTPMRVEYYGSRDFNLVAKEVGAGIFPLTMVKPQAGVRPEMTMFTMADQKERMVYFVDYKQVQAHVNWWHKGLVSSESQEARINMFNQYFGGDMSSVVFQNIREAKALAYSTYCFVRVPDYAGQHVGIMGFVGTQADKIHDAIGAMEELMNKMPLDTGVYNLAKQSLINRLNTNVIEPESYLGMYQYLVNKGFSVVMPSENERKIVNITMDDIKKFHQEELINKPWAMSVVADKEKVKKSDLAKYGKVVELSLTEIFGY